MICTYLFTINWNRVCCVKSRAEPAVDSLEEQREQSEEKLEQKKINDSVLTDSSPHWKVCEETAAAGLAGFKYLQQSVLPHSTHSQQGSLFSRIKTIDSSSAIKTNEEHFFQNLFFLLNIW